MTINPICCFCRYICTTFADRPLIIGSFSAASNVDGTLTDPEAITELLHSYGAYSLFDYAAAGPYVRIDVRKSQMDAVFLSPHKVIHLARSLLVQYYVIEPP
jgi:selenocysteine lyase/cysteine desulfurase